MRVVGSRHRSGQNGAQRYTQRNHVIVGDPAAKVEELAADGWLRIGRSKDCLRLFFERRYIARPDTNTHFATIAKRNYDPRSNDNRIREPVFNCVGKVLEERERER